MAKQKIKKKKHNPPVITTDSELIIIGEGFPPLTSLPETGDHLTWYYYQGNYYFWNFQSLGWVNHGGDRPTKPPVNP